MVQWNLAYHANCWGPLGGDAVGVTSITQLTYRTFGDMGQAFEDIARAGYQGVEVFDGNLMDVPAREFTQMLGINGLALVAAYSGGNFIFDDIIEEELARIRRVADRAAELGAPHLVVGGGATRATGIRDADYGKLGAALDRVAGIARERGLTAHYHPHLSTIVEGPEQVRRIFSETGIDFCPDTAHLAAAGGDPAAMIREHRDRISYVHLKGLQREPFAFTPLDRGDVDSGPIVDALIDTGFDGWVTVELDAWDDPLGGAVQSRNYLESRLKLA
ncbi:sugar phosphate isomerase/epimerase family protein [Acuticoccus sp. MNP-M23]|uniref:sugar phosphate isomerase/epimerase family protein n=1 Tax=Acuticoccus sp. MNP-M23 TaxID=3072793 RepID=UPI0028151443|nr:sugar phosphate isomerase/epimerase family protein [Acuticoccus sp. MNP-M23]WMS43773.1 sugar phosphate isomerase/epimerase family protein [Acuticoccus sp. MNP-M23]